MLRIVAILYLCFSFSVSAQSLTETIHICRQGSSEQIARQIHKLSTKKLTHSQIQDLFGLLDNREALKKIGNKTEVRDIAIIILQEISNILASKRNRNVKAIISFKNDSEEIFRYHLSDLRDKEFQKFKSEVHSWLLKKIPA